MSNDTTGNAGEELQWGPTSWANGSTDLGIKNPPNQDAIAVMAHQSESTRTAILAVSDGVSTSANSDVASKIAVDVATRQLSSSLSDTDDVAPAVLADHMRDAVFAANAAISAAAGDNQSGYACTFVLSLVHHGYVMVANLGDSRAYWFGDDGTNMLLTTDDSMAQLSIELGTARDVAESGRQAHAITRWLGPNAPAVDPQLAGFRVAGPGWLLICSDGLWNYASAPEDLRKVWDSLSFPSVTSAKSLSDQLVAWANGCGGHDNITVGLVRIDAAEQPEATAENESAHQDSE